MRNFILDDKEFIKSYEQKNDNKVIESLIVIPPKSNIYSNIHVPRRFYDVVASHIIAPYLAIESYNPPIYLAIEGEPGVGKTAQSIATCTQKGFTAIYISASTLSGSHEDEAKEKMQTIYSTALQYRKSGPVAIIIDDFHKGIINTDSNVKKTINTDVLTGYMMNLAEHNGSVHIPTILTANDLSNVYAPLLRIGRAETFKWDPQHDEKREIVKRILSEFIIEKREDNFDDFFEEYSDNNIAFFVQLKTKYIQSLLMQIIHEEPTFDEATIAKMNYYIIKHQKKVTYTDLRQMIDSNKPEGGLT